MESCGKVKYAVIDAFTSEPFKGNPAAVCLLEGEETSRNASDAWMKSVAAEFNLSETCFLVPLPLSSEDSDLVVPRFQLRWFTPVDEVNLCGHATLASAHFLFTSICEKYDKVEFVTKSGILSAKKIFNLALVKSPKSTNASKRSSFAIELNFPLISYVDSDFSAASLISGTLNGAQVIDVKKAAGDFLIVVLESGLDVANIKPQIEEIRECLFLGVVITGPAPEGSRFDFFTRFFCPKLGVDEASPRGGVLDLVLEEKSQRLRIRGEAVTVMTGTLLC